MVSARSVRGMPRDRESLFRLIEGSVKDPAVIQAVRATDRADFVPEQLRHEAYRDRPVTLPLGQTTSQPSLIAHMIEAAAIAPTDRVLEIGSGYGYQTALIARLAREVVSIERLSSLAEAARSNLNRAGIDNVEVIVGNGWDGVPERAPFQAMIVSAAAGSVPAALAEQLDDGGRLVIPVRVEGSDDVLLFRKDGPDLRRVRLVTPARFVPFVQAGPE